MKFWRYLIAICPLAALGLIGAADVPDNVEVISWESQNRSPDGGFQRLTLGANGRSEISVMRFGKPKKPNPGWTVTNDWVRVYYRNVNSLSEADAKKKFADALAAGVEQLMTLPSGDPDGDTPTIKLTVDRKTKEIIVPDVTDEGDKDNKESEHRRRFLAVQKILGEFDTDAFEKPATKADDDADMISWETRAPWLGSNRVTLWADGRSEILLKSWGNPVKPNPGWTVTNERPWSYYRKVNPFGKADAKKKFADALTAGIEQLKTIRADGIVYDAGATVVTMKIRGKYKEIVVSGAQSEGRDGKQESHNYRRFLAVEKILGKFDTDAVDILAPVPDAIDMISWERIRTKPDADSDRISLWRDGRSEIVLKRWGEPARPKSGWTVAKDAISPSYSIYRRRNPLSPALSKRTFSRALDVGIEELRTFDTDDADGNVTVVTIQRGRDVKQTIIPEFRPEGEKNNPGSENHRRFQVVQKLLGKFDTDAFEGSR